MAYKPAGVTLIKKAFNRETMESIPWVPVKNLPTIVIDGNIEFISQIPPVGKLGDKIGEYLKSKENLR